MEGEIQPVGGSGTMLASEGKFAVNPFCKCGGQLVTDYFQLGSLLQLVYVGNYPIVLMGFRGIRRWLKIRFGTW